MVVFYVVSNAMCFVYILRIDISYNLIIIQSLYLDCLINLFIDYSVFR